MNTPIFLFPQKTRLFKNHGSSIGFWEGWVDAPNKVIIQHARLLDGEISRHEYEAKGKNIGKANETSGFHQACLELESRIKKQIDKGYVRTQDEAKAPATNALGLLKPMLAHPIDKVKPEKIDWSQAFVQPKLDGHRAMFKDGVLYSRQGKELNLPHIIRAIKESGLDHLHLDGEIYIHGYNLFELASLIKRDQHGTEHLEYHIYDQVKPSPFPERIIELVTVFNGAKAHPRLRPVDTVPVTTLDEVLALHQDYRKSGYEGTMLRHGEEHYRDGKRSQHLLKIKEFHDAEFVITGFTEGKPYVRGNVQYRVPIWICDAGDGKTFTVTGQGDMYEKHALAIEAEKHIGKKLTTKYHYLINGIPQLPIALRFHEEL